MSEAVSIEWHSQARNYDREKRRSKLPFEPTSDHPLREVTVTVSEMSLKKSDAAKLSSQRPAFIDPLSQAFEGKDPLSVFAAEANVPSFSKGSRTSTSTSDALEPWSAKRAGILSKFTTTEKLSIVTVMASSVDRKDSSAGTVSEKVKNRLEQLDDLEEGSLQETLNLSQQEYIHRIEELNTSLIQAWQEDQRVKSLKIVIQCAKLLSDISVIQFYPSKFVLITDILDTFGRLVYDRIVDKAMLATATRTGIARHLTEILTPDQVPESAKETCRNWFFKIASIRELLPRFYVETAILRCYSFLTSDEYSRAFMRLVTMVRGIGDPLVAAYARCYLCRVGVLVSPGIRDHLMPCFDDLLLTFTGQIDSESTQLSLTDQRTTVPQYIVLYAPALDWVLSCLAHGATEALLDTVLQRCADMTTGNGLLLNSIMASFSSTFIAARAVELARKIRDLDDVGLPRYLLYCSLGQRVAVADPPDDHKLLLLNEVWKVITKLQNAGEYIACVESWMEFVLNCFGHRELNTVLGDVIKHMLPDRAFESHYSDLQSIVSKILLKRSSNFADLFSHEKFMPFIDMFQKESVRVDVCKRIMDAYVREHYEPMQDPLITHTLMRICRLMHDSINALSVDDEVRAIGTLISSGLVRAVSFGSDLEQQLAFLMECRGAFCNIDPVIQHLVHAVNRVAAELHRTAASQSGGHTRRTGSFARACAAYAFITIPSLNGVFHRLALYLESGQVAMMNQCLSQADAFFRAAVALIPSVPRFLDVDGKIRSTEPLLVDYICNFLSTLVVVPDSPELGTLYLLRGLLNVVQDYQWDANTDSRAMIYIKVLAMLSTVVQESLPYHVVGLDSNDALYGGDPQFIDDVDRIAVTLLREVGTRLRELGASPDTVHRQSVLALELFSCILAHGDLQNERVCKLAASLWTMAVQHGQLDPKLMASTAQSVAVKASRLENSSLTQLAKQTQCRFVLQI